MDDFIPSSVTPLTQEVRLATTMTGGVSLAVWMGGVAREINLLSQASRWRHHGDGFPTNDPLSKESSAALKLYARLIDLLDVVAEVDVVSGTSAGGVNAAFLASSRVTGADLGGLRELWLDLGSLEDLLREPSDKAVPALMYGDERMFATLAKQIPALGRGPFPAPPRQDPPSTTLYITSTLLTGETGRFTDSFGTLVQDVDRRGLFTFTEEQLARDATAPALALAARSSVSFPAAFEPSFIPFTDQTPETSSLPARPAMAEYTSLTRAHWVADGSLLDNRPIDVLVKRVFDRPAEGPVRRVLLFVVPSSGPAPDLIAAAPHDDVTAPLGLVDGLLKDLSAMTTQSIAADLRAVRAHQDRMEVRTDARLRLTEVAAALPDGSRLLTGSLLQDYRGREAGRQSRPLVAALLRLLSTWLPPGPDDASTGSAGSARQRIPKEWETSLTVGGDAEAICRHQITTSIAQSWSRSTTQLPDELDDLAGYGQAAYDLAKATALAVVRAAYQLATSAEDRAALTELITSVHAAAGRPLRPDPEALARHVCAGLRERTGSLQDTAEQLANRYVEQTTVRGDSWRQLGLVFVDNEPMLSELAGGVSSQIGETVPGSVLDRDRQAADQLTSYLRYLRPTDGAEAVARRLFDLAATQRAMLPVDADEEQSFELVQVSADTRSLLAPRRSTAQEKLTGMQLHHFGAFYKKSWRANDWLWGRLDAAGWLVHVLLDPRRIRTVVQQNKANREDGETGADWFLRQLRAFEEPGAGGTRLASQRSAPADELVSRDKLIDELRFVDDDAQPVPASVPLTALWLAQAWQRLVVDEELGVLADTVTKGEPGKDPDWSPATSRAWAARVLDDDANLPALLNDCPVPGETFGSDRGSPLMVRTMAKAAATASAAIGSVGQLPAVVKPAASTLRTITLGGYRVVSATKGKTRLVIVSGAALLVLGVAAAVQSAVVFGVTGLVMAAVGGYLVVFGTWQMSSRLLFALLSLTVVGAVAASTTPVVRGWLFGSSAGDTGLIGRHLYWVGNQWWHPLVVVGAVALTVTLLAVAIPRRRR